VYTLSNTPADLKELIGLKAAALLHDPPHKSFLIGYFRERFGEMHSKEAESFKVIVLSGTKLLTLTEGALGKVGFCDRLASSIERRFLRGSILGKWPRGIYLEYSRLHNIFNPDKSIDLLSRSKLTIEELVKRVQSVGSKINQLLRNINGVVDEVTQYNLLYALLEPTWYAEGLPPGLADTRTPTHTIFDHLYASATMANILGDTSKLSLRGYYVLIDFPGIQSFIGSSRKAGDFWAGSWLLSNLMWRTSTHFTLKYGFDTLVSPTPRMNPYTLKTIMDTIRGKVSDVELDRILNTYSRALGVEVEVVKSLMDQPIVPATISLLLPQAYYGNIDSVVEQVEKAYMEAWSSILSEVRERHPLTASYAYKFMLKELEKVESIVETPPQGVRIHVVDIEKLYNALYHCLVDEIRDECNLLPINTQELGKLYSLPQDVRGELVSILLWHLLVTNAVRLSKTHGIVKHPVPRAFFIYRGNKLEPITQSIVERGGDWIHCTLCGLEPVILKAEKKVEAPDEYSEEFKERVKRIMGDEAESTLEQLKRIIKPGEALGAYCLLKRLVYLSKVGELPIVTTDVLSLEEISQLFSTVDSKVLDSFKEKIRNRKVEQNVPSEVVKSYMGVIDWLFIPVLGKKRLHKGVQVTRELGVLWFKDIELAASTIGSTYESIINDFNDALRDTCKDLDWDERMRLILAFKEDVIRGVDEGLLKDIVGFIDKLIESKDSLSVDRLCRALRVKTRYAIVRGDGDNIGKFYKGEVVSNPSEYIDKIMKIVKEAVMQSQYSSEVKDRILVSINDSLDTLKKALSALEFKGIPVTPAWTQSLSLSLILASIVDYVKVIRNSGILVFSGGDDVLALFPPETAFKATLELRETFSDDGFIRPGSGVGAAPMPTTGRSFSLRFVELKDHMNTEFEEALKLLEDTAKKANWMNGRLGKDTLVVSDSRSMRHAVLPLHRDLRSYTEGSLLINFLVSIGALSTNIPEDYESNIPLDIFKDSLDGIERLVQYIISRNIVVKDESLRRSLIDALGVFTSRASGIKVSVRDYRSNLISQLIESIGIMRRQL
jgi:CRISPR-associated protein Cmr2